MPTLSYHTSAIGKDIYIEARRLRNFSAALLG